MFCIWSSYRKCYAFQLSVEGRYDAFIPLLQPVSFLVNFVYEKDADVVKMIDLFVSSRFRKHFQLGDLIGWC